MRIEREILKEIDETTVAIDSLKASGADINELGFYDGWIQALSWVLTNCNNETEGES